MGWLPPPEKDFRAKLRALQGELVRRPLEPGFYERVISLATAALDNDQLVGLARLAAQIQASHDHAPGFSRGRFAALGDGTLSLIMPAIAGSALRHGMLLDVVETGYSTAVQDVMDKESALHQHALDFALIASDARLLGLAAAATSSDAAATKVDAAFQRLRLIVDGLRSKAPSTILVQTIVPPIEPLFGSFDRIQSGSPFAMVEELNRRIAAWAAEGDVILVDVARLAASVGLEHWHDPRYWYGSKLSFSPVMIPVYADLIARTIAAARGKSRKCLILDLDNTLWGGVIGDDGVQGITLGQGSPSGEAFLAIQRMALELRNRGIVLAVCSKNEIDVARAPFREHPEMLLREENVAVFQANWMDKAANIKAIAEMLNIGVDALVFVDDNPAERLQVRGQLPLVAVPELPDDPAFYPRILAAAGYFEAISLSQEDRDRAAYYQANALRATAFSATGDIDTYLASLEMTCTIRRVDAVSRSRVSQLINKSNQFNLTTRRYSEVEVQVAESDPKRHLVQVRLVDRFGDNGIISVIIADKTRECWEIDTWLMSCRVLGRRVEEAVLAHLTSAASAEGAKYLIGRYLPSSKNRMVSDHFRKLGFTLLESRPNGETLWRLDIAAYVVPALPMRVEDSVGTALEQES